MKMLLLLLLRIMPMMPVMMMMMMMMMVTVDDGGGDEDHGNDNGAQTQMKNLKMKADMRSAFKVAYADIAHRTKVYPIRHFCNAAVMVMEGDDGGRLRKLGDTTYLVSNETLAISQLILAVGLDGDVGGTGDEHPGIEGSVVQLTGPQRPGPSPLVTTLEH
ncbi:hypothetical protein AK812_SmicGene8264 [Symbiodinium microadriaticum]|uniref:Uncharacterized protein n=1 Tax=Symbiodinium microadriaticum TaxID=2951 RepID=A0A1Q9ELB6_SYMMI|nr:hypothetical protein AK812_SmicGene8264 [Symbiodinium microadriaticum]